MAVEEKLSLAGVVQESLPNLMFRVTLDNGHSVLAHMAGRMRRARIRGEPGRPRPRRGLSVRPQPRATHLPPQVNARRTSASSARSGRTRASHGPHTGVAARLRSASAVGSAVTAWPTAAATASGGRPSPLHPRRLAAKRVDERVVTPAARRRASLPPPAARPPRGSSPTRAWRWRPARRRPRGRPAIPPRAAASRSPPRSRTSTRCTGPPAGARTCR